MSNPVLTNAEAAVKQLQSWTDLPLDYSPESLEAVEDLLETASHQALNEQTQAALVELLGCYILEVGMREFGGKYAWSEERNQFVLVVGEPEFSVAIMTKGRVRGRLSGDLGDHIQFFYGGFATGVENAVPGTSALYI